MTPAASAEPDAIATSLVAGSVRDGARLITRIERGEPDLVPLLQRLYRIGGRARTIGVTGPPGAGKSTLVSGLIGLWRKRGLRVAVLAVDPSSPFSGGAVLGDRLRMVEHGCDDGVFVRSMAARGQLGGLAKAAGDALTVLCAMPWDIVLVETVGVGQNETDIVRHAELVIVLQTPMGGDDIQAAKAGVTEIADIFVVNKADHPRADHTVRQLTEMIALGARLHPERPWVPPVVKTKAIDGDGLADLADHIARWFDHLAEHPRVADQLGRARLRHRVNEILQDMLSKRVHSEADGWLDRLIEPVLSRQSDPYAVAARLLDPQ